ncbi:hypothetical protein ACFQY5_25115 [Paeniroseomonas aquatica]
MHRRHLIAAAALLAPTARAQQAHPALQPASPAADAYHRLQGAPHTT